ncbi:MAG: hypothetical protein JRE24_07260 [Deltaproteobacteria bacterium]|nr:hypothetical protein [Deltaproteobacteria bacterium]
MDAKAIKKVLESVSRGSLTTDQALEQLKRLPFEDLSYACVDHHRSGEINRADLGCYGGDG